jgi:hypothetical protein
VADRERTLLFLLIFSFAIYVRDAGAQVEEWRSFDLQSGCNYTSLEVRLYIQIAEFVRQWLPLNREVFGFSTVRSFWA